MVKKNWVVWLTVALALSSMVIARIAFVAASGTAFTYQGYLIDSSSSANGSYDFEFVLYDSLAGGSQVGSTLTFTGLAVSDGEFTVDLDFGADIFDGNTRWLEARVRLNGDTGAYTTLGPRAELGATLEAIYAEDEDAVIGNEWNVSLTEENATLRVEDAAGTQEVSLRSIVASRMVIDSLPYTISQPGSYYLADQLTGAADTNGITIAASNVTLDLTGFALVGSGGSTGSGITASGTYSNVHIYNGSVYGWAGIGIDTATLQTSIFEHLRVSNNVGGGMVTGDSAVVTLVTLSHNMGDQLTTGENSSVNKVTAIFGGAELNNSSNIIDGVDGIKVGDGSTVTESTAFDNQGNGIEGGIGVTVVNCVVTDNEEGGVFVGDGATVSQNTAYDNGVSSVGGDGFTVGGGSIVRENIASYNNGNGISVTGDGTEVLFNKLHENDNDGIEVSGNNGRIDRNSSTDNDVLGYDISGTGNLVIRNVSAGDFATYSIGVGNIVGTILNVVNVGEISTTEPFANFEY